MSLLLLLGHLGYTEKVMRPFEYIYTILRIFEHPLYQRVNHTLRRITRTNTPDCLIVDVGGRKSNYTIGLPCAVVITDIPRETALQDKLDLGATDSMIKAVLSRRSNVKKYVIDDMTNSNLPSALADIIVAVEVLEHVTEDDVFIENVRRVLKTGGYFLMTTPNGDEIPEPYPDHKRHYKREELRRLLDHYFGHVEIDYCVKGTTLFKLGLFRWSLRAPFRTLVSMIANLLSYRLEVVTSDGNHSERMQHIFAICHGVRPPSEPPRGDSN
jgi:SAM-dependent methyltransferase